MWSTTPTSSRFSHRDARQKAMITSGRIENIRFYGERDPMEQQYDLRAVTFCRHGNGFITRSSAVLTGIKDTRPPRVFGQPEPADAILGVGDNLLLRFNEPIAGNYLDEDNNFQLMGITNSTGITTGASLFAGDEITLEAVSTNADGYYFTQWENGSKENPRTITLTENANYVAFFAKYQFTVTFLDEDGETVLDERLWDYGDIPSCVSPAKPDDDEQTYKFKAWEPALIMVTADAVYKATYEASPKLQFFTVTFVDKDDQPIGEPQTIESGSAAIAPEAPEVEGYTFIGWDIDFTNVTEDMVIYAQYERNVYNVTFVDYNGEVLLVEKVPYGSDAKGPETNPEREGFTFTGWDKPITNITSDLTVQAVYEDNTVYYTVTFLDWNGDLLFTEKVAEGKDAKGPDTDPEREGYDFTGWSKPITNITADIIVIAQYEKAALYTLTVKVEPAEGGTFTVTGLDENNQGTSFAEFTITATPNEGYELAGWKDGDELLDNKTTTLDGVLYGDVTITILFKKKTGTGLDQSPMTNDQSPIKLLREGVIYIERSGRLYDMNGRLVN